jgi:glycosyltransferase involved in cell wall biosynthesis
MKILLVTNSLSGGAGKACTRLFKALEANGQNVKLLYLDGADVDNENIVPMYQSVRKLFLKQILNIPGYLFNKIYLGTLNTNYRSPNSYHSLEKHPLVNWADVINLHWVPEFIDYNNFFKGLGKNVVWTLHDMLPFSGGYHYLLDSKQKNFNIESKIQKIKSKAIKNASLRIIAPSKWLTSISQESKVFGEFGHRHIFNPIPLSIFKPLDKKFARKTLNLPEEGKIIVFSADSINSVRKGMKILLSAFNLVDNKDLTLVSIGRGEVKEKLNQNYIHLGSLKDDYTISLLYSAADVSVVPSLEDNSPNTIIESLACGCPVIGFNIGGIPELIVSDKMGVLVTELTSKGLAKGIKESLNCAYFPEVITDFIKSECNYKIVAERYLEEFNNFENE